MDNTIHIITSELMRAHPEYRAGQAYSNAAEQVDPVWMRQNVLADPTTLKPGPVPNPFYLDANLPAFLIKWHEGH